MRGRVLPIGGLKEKLLAAKRGLIARVLIPAENEKDLREVPSGVRKGMEIVPVTHMDEVLSILFGGLESAVLSEEPLALESDFHLKQ